VPGTTLWWVEGSTYLGGSRSDTRLTPFLLHLGGHIGLCRTPVSPPARHATAMLQATLPVANGLASTPRW
jgi:hypothetical protein